MHFQVDSSFLGIGSVLVYWSGIKFLCHLSFPQQANVPVTKSFPEKQRGPVRELRGRKGDAAFEPHHPRPHEPALINPLGEQTEPVAVRRGEGPVISFEGKAVKSVRTAWRQARKRAGLDSSVTLYSWRHTLSRWMRSHGVDKWEVQGQLGHRGGVTERYAEYAPDYQAKATAAIELFWNRVVGDSSGTVRWTMSAKYLISWCRLRGLNSRPSVYKTAALPLS
jgi:hypothetical protein